MPARRGGKGYRTDANMFPHTQCVRCNRIMEGRHAGTNPGRKVHMHDEHGTYATPEEARAAGLDPDQTLQFGNNPDPSYDLEYSYGHTLCEDCERAMHEEHLEHRRQKQQQRMQDGDEPPPEGEEE